MSDTEKDPSLEEQEEKNNYEWDESTFSSLRERLDGNNKDDIAHLFQEELSAADTADFFARLSSEDRFRYLEEYSEYILPETFLYMDDSLSSDLLESLPAISIANIISELDSDDALDLLAPLEYEAQQEVLKKLSKKMRAAIQEGLNFPEESAGRLMQREVVSVPENWTVGKTIDYLRTAAEQLPSDFFDIIVITPTYHVVGEIPLNRLIRAQRKVKVKELTLDSSHPIPADMDQEDVARIFQRENLASAPVVDEDQRLIGVITIDDIITIVREEAEDDALKLVGVEGTGGLYSAIFSTTRARFKWLFVNLLTAILASIVISFFDATIEQIVALAVLMPIVASMGGNAGTQALTVAVRALATRELSSGNSMRVIGKETMVGMLNGLAFAVITGLVTAFWFQNFALGGVIALAMVTNLLAAGFFGASIPILFSKMGKDPALAGTVFLTTATDIIGFFVFLGLAAFFLL